MTHWLSYLLFRCFHGVVVLLPEGRIAPVSRMLAGLTVSLGLARRIVHRNLEIAFGASLSAAQREQLYRDNMHATWLTALEVLRMTRHDRSWLRQRASFAGWEHVESALARGRGVLMLGGHFGNSELQNIVMALAGDGRYFSFTGRQRNPWLEGFVMRMRVRAGVQPVPRNEEAARRMIQVLKDNGLMGLCADLNSRRTPIFVPFFGKLASVPEGMATLAVRSGCAVLFSWIRRVGPSQHRIFIKPLTWEQTGHVRRDEEAFARSFLAALEDVIREQPAEYLWLHKRYRTRPASDPDPVY
jgi:Kdo2-lipid IVA lauroyltransferase/acyltransferase